MNLLNPISTIMTRDIITLAPDASIAEAAKIFKAHKVHHIPIVEGEKLVGIVSVSDFLFFRRGFLDNANDEKIEEIRMNNYDVSFIMTKGIGKLEPDQKINVALDVFRKNLFHALPVVEGEKLVGIVTTWDIINHLAEDNSAVASYER